MKKPSPSILVSSAALVVALGGTSYAAVQVSGANIKNNSVTSADVKNKSLTGKDVKNGSLKSKDIKDGVIPTGARWALVNAAGQIEAQSGGFTVVSAYPTLGNTSTGGAPDNSLRANGNVYINAGEPLANNAITVSLVLQNTSDQNGDAITNGRAPLGAPGSATATNPNPEFAGEISASQCGTPITACAPPGTAVPNVFVVSPHNSDGTVTTGTDRKRFYVVISGDSSDRVDQ